MAATLKLAEKAPEKRKAVKPRRKYAAGNEQAFSRWIDALRRGREEAELEGKSLDDPATSKLKEICDKRREEREKNFEVE